MIRVTAHCTFCTHSFVPATDPTQGGLIMDDAAGNLCCDDCLHPRCGFGHATEDEANTCETLMDLCDPYDDEPSYGDSDAAYEGWRDHHMLELSS